MLTLYHLSFAFAKIYDKLLAWKMQREKKSGTGGYPPSKHHEKHWIVGIVLEIDWNWQILAVVNSLILRISCPDDF